MPFGIEVYAPSVDFHLFSSYTPILKEKLLIGLRFLIKILRLRQTIRIKYYKYFQFLFFKKCACLIAKIIYYTVFF